MGQLGNGTPHEGKIDVTSIGVGCSFFTQNPLDPPAAGEITNALVHVLQKWMLLTPVRVRETLPVIQDGRMIALFVWWDPVNQPLGP
jgi:hypothetical protein